MNPSKFRNICKKSNCLISLISYTVHYRREAHVHLDGYREYDCQVGATSRLCCSDTNG